MPWLEERRCAEALFKGLQPPLLLFIALDRIGQRAWVRYVVVGLAGVSIGIPAIGLAYSGDWGSELLEFDTHPERVWYWRESLRSCSVHNFLSRRGRRLRYSSDLLPVQPKYVRGK